MCYRNKILLSILCGILLVNITACNKNINNDSSVLEEISESNYDYKTKPPVIYLADPLASSLTYDNDIASGNYDWTYRDGEENISTVACGINPLDFKNKELPEIEVRNYPNLETVPYVLSIEALDSCDLVIVEEYQIQDLESETKPNVVKYKYNDLIELKRNCVYNIILTWNEENMDINGFFGNAQYTFITK